MSQQPPRPSVPRRMLPPQPPIQPDLPASAALRSAAIVHLALLGASVLTIDGLPSGEYRHLLEHARRQLAHLQDSAAIQGLARQVAEATQSHLRARAELLAAQEREFEETVAALAGAVVQFASGSSAFAHQVQERSDALAAQARTADPATLRPLVITHLGELRRLAQARELADSRQLEELRGQVHALEQRLAVAVSEAATDVLTGLGNRAAWERRATDLVARLAAGDTAFAVALLDLDHFKQVNDRHGHAAGDQTLTRFAGHCRQAFGEDDFVARFGGDEFVALIEAPTPAHAEQHLHRLMASVNGPPADPLVPAFTFSAGLAFAVLGESVTALLARADTALYAAKSAGRNRVVIAPPPKHARATTQR